MKRTYLYLRYYIYSLIFYIKNLNLENKRDFKCIPIIIISFNQYNSLKKLVNFLDLNGFKNLVIIDNNSTYKPLLRYLEVLEVQYKVYKLNENHGHRVFWIRKDLFSIYTKDYYVITDPDILPCKDCPQDFLKVMYSQLIKYPEVNKVGFNLKIDDIPDFNENKDIILNWESNFWSKKNNEGHYIAKIDTTFALYRPSFIKPIYKNFFRAIRLAPPYSARHLGWYINMNSLTEEQSFYISNTNKSSSWLNCENDGKINIYKNMPVLSIIYVSYNTLELTIASIASVYKYTKKITFEIIVVDNASKDGSLKAIQKQFPQVICIQSGDNIGFGRANNLGLQKARGRYVLFLNTDTYLESPAIDGLMYEMEKEKYKHVAVAGAKLTKPDGSFNVSAGLLPSFPHFIKGSFWKYFYSKAYYNALTPRSISIENEPYSVDYVSGADFLVRKELLDKVGGFDSRFFLYNEESELTHRIYKEFPNMVSMIFPQYKIVHISQGSSSTSSESKAFKWQQAKSRALYYRITLGKIQGFMYLITSFKRIYS